MEDAEKLILTKNGFKKKKLLAHVVKLKLVDFYPLSTSVVLFNSDFRKGYHAENLFNPLLYEFYKYLIMRNKIIYVFWEPS